MSILKGEFPSARASRGRSEDSICARLAAIVRSSADAIVGTTLEGIITDWNPAAERIYGYSAAEVIGQHVSLVIPDERMAEARAILERIRRGDSVEGVETVRRTKDGRLIDVSLTFSPVWDDAGTVVATSTIIRDITERRRLERELQASEAKYRALVEQLPAVIYEQANDERKTPTYFSPQFATFTGYAVAEIMDQKPGESWHDFVHPDDRERVVAEDERSVATGSAFRGEYRLLRRDGSSVWVRDDCAAVRDASGEIIAWQGVLLDISDRVQTEQALSASEIRFRTAFENAAIGMTLVSPDGRILQANAAIANMLGTSPEALVGRHFQEFTHPDDVETSLTSIRSALAGERDRYELEKRYIRENGQVVWAHLSASLVRNGDGTPHYLIAQVQDITARKAAELELAQRTEELRASEVRFRSLVEQLPAAVYLLSTRVANESPLYFSPYIEVITGETPAEALISHQHWFDLIHPEDQPRVVAADDLAGERVEAFRAEYRHRRKDGSFVWVQDEYVPVKDETGRAVAWLGVMLDITERIAAEEAQARLAAIVASAEDAIISSTIDGTITSWNKGAERLYGYLAEEILGRSFEVLRPTERDDPLRKERIAAVQAGMAVEPFETARQRRDGSTVDVAITLSPIRDRAGTVIGLSSIARDITARKQAEATLAAALSAAEAANQAKSHFLAVMSHELRTPLQAVLGYSEFLLAESATAFTVEQREDLRFIQQGGQRMLSLISQLLDLSRVEAGRLDVMLQPVDVAVIVEQVRQDIAPLANAKGLDVRIDVPSDMPPVLGDADRLRQILLNLAGNAVKFTEQGKLEITARTSEDGAAIVVRDSGSGIAPEALPHIFEMFHQVDSYLSRRHGGVGLGLAIAQKLAELMDGQISVESQLGVGSTFTLEMPVV